MDLRLVDRIALITGGGSGIGAAIAGVLAREGAHVYVADVNDDAAEQRAAALRSLGSHADAVGLDVTSPASIDSAFRRIGRAEAKLDILINSAGILRSGPLSEMASQDWEALSRVNVGGIYACSMAALSLMVPRSYGKILNLASISAIKGGGIIGNVLYGASKAAAVALTKGFAREYGPGGINVNAIAPGLTSTPMIAALSEDDRERIVTSIPVRKLAEPEDIANLAVFLVSDLAGYINGSTVVIDGGVLTI